MTIARMPPGPSTNDPDNFDVMADAWVAATNPMIDQINASNAQASTDAATAAAAASTATTASSTATLAAGAAAASAAAVATSLVTSTSNTPVAIRTGDTAFVTQLGRQYQVGVPIYVVDTTDPSYWMSGKVTGYAGGIVSLYVTRFGGAGTRSNWTISVSGVEGPAGSGALSGNADGAVNLKRGSDLLISATPDIWSIGGNSCNLNGSPVTVTGFPAAPQSGATRRLTMRGYYGFITSQAFRIQGIPDGAFVGMGPGDVLDVYAETATIFIGTITRADGSAVVNRVMYFDSTTNSALDYRNGQCQRWAPGTGAKTLTVANWPPTGQLGELLLEGYQLGLATITWPNVSWIKYDGTSTTVFSQSGVTLQTAGADFILLWTRDGGATIFGKVMR